MPHFRRYQYQAVTWPRPAKVTPGTFQRFWLFSLFFSRPKGRHESSPGVSVLGGVGRTAIQSRQGRLRAGLCHKQKDLFPIREPTLNSAVPSGLCPFLQTTPHFVRGYFQPSRQMPGLITSAEPFGRGFWRLRKASGPGRKDVPQGLKAHCSCSIYVRPEGRTLQKDGFFQPVKPLVVASFIYGLKARTLRTRGFSAACKASRA
jgi:hypothetical protein